VRIVYVAGFFKHVLPELQKRVREHLESGAAVWIPPYRSTAELNINWFKGSFLSNISRGATEILVCLFVMRGNDDLMNIVQAIVEEGKARSSELTVKVEPFKNARDSKGIIGAIEAFSPSIEVPPPTGLDVLPQWVEEKHAEKIVFHPRATNAVKKSQYQDVPLVYSAIDLLAIEYRNMRMSSAEGLEKNRANLDAKLNELGLSLSPATDASRAGEQGDEYFVTYPLGSKSTKLLDLHLCKGSDREERFCLRIYFFWDEKVTKVVIGWLPSHLDTRAT